MIVRYFASEWRVKSLLRKYGKLYKGEYSSFPTQPSHTPQNHRHQPLFILEDAAGDMAIRFLQWAADDRQVSQSGKPLCTGASLGAVPKLARGHVSAPLRSAQSQRPLDVVCPLGTPARQWRK